MIEAYSGINREEISSLKQEDVSKEAKQPIPEVEIVDGVELKIYHGKFVDARELEALHKARKTKEKEMRNKELELLDGSSKDSIEISSSGLMFVSSSGEQKDITSQAELLEIDIKNLNFQSFSTYVEQVADIAPEVFAEKFEDVLDQFEYFSFIKYDKYRNRDSVSEIMGLNQDIRTGMWKLGHSEASIDSAQLERVFGYLDSDNKNLIHFGNEALFHVIRSDFRNSNNGKESLGLYSRAKTLLVEKITSSDPLEFSTGKMMVDAFWADAPYSDLFETMITGINMVDDAPSLRNVFGSIANRMSLEDCREALGDAVQEKILSAEKYAKVQAAMGFEKQVYGDISSFYEEIMDDWENYSPNEELHSFEENLLADLNGNILDLGFGSGRHLESLWKRGRTAIGLDVVAEFGKRIKQKHPEAKLMIGSWHDIPLKSASVDNAYCLGRSILHNQSPDDYYKIFNEVDKILKDDGQFIIDLPDFESDHYVEAREDLARKVLASGINYFEEGSIVDSPDGVNYMARFLPTEEQFNAIARLSGFDVSIIEKKEFSTYEGGKNVNVYWSLTKSKEELTAEKRLELAMLKRTGRPALEISWF